MDGPAFFGEIAALVVAGALIALVSFRIGLVPIVGFLLAGVVIGPNALGLVRDLALVQAAADVGIVLLLFTIGIEFKLERLARIQRLIFGGGGLQVVLSTAATAAVLGALGIDWRVGVFTGFLVAQSSTAVMLKLLADRGETNQPQGQVALGVSLFQDLATIAMVLLLPALAGAGGSAAEIGWALARAVLLIAGVLLIARRVMPRFLELVARTCSPELFLLSIIAICFGTAYVASLLGVSLSLGAFLAGLMVSESSFSSHALGEIMPLQILFSATFFLSVGMLLDIGFLVQNLPLVLGVVAAVLVIKVATAGAGVLLLGYRLPVAAASALLLAQVGEFAFVLMRAGAEVGLTPAGLGENGTQALIAGTVLLMTLTPVLSGWGSRYARRDRASAASAAAMAAEADAAGVETTLADHVVVAGYGASGRRLVRALRGSGVPYLITTLNPDSANEAEDEGLPVMRGDATRAATLQRAGIERARMLVIADDDPAAAERIAAVARSLNPTLHLVVRTRYEAEVRPLHEVGADRVITEELESIVQLFAEVLRTFGVSAVEIEAREEALRAGDYRGLEVEGAAALQALPDCTLDDDCIGRRTVTIRAGSPAAGASIGALGLAERFGIVVERLQRDGTTVEAPAADTRLEPGDRLELRGTARAFAEGAEPFRPGRTAGASAVATGAGAGTVADATIRRESMIELTPGVGSGCTHVDAIRRVRPGSNGCETCLRTGSRWVHLRVCMTCGHVGCCDSSPGRHATAHHHATGHPIVRSLEPGETWGWCYVDRAML